MSATDPGRGSFGRIGCATAARPRDDRELRQLRAAAYLRGRDVLDIGTGEGRLALLLAPLARSVVGVDPDPAAIRAARRAARAAGLANVRFRAAPAQRLGVGRERFDTAIFSWSL